MNKIELLEKIKMLLAECKVDEANAKKPLDQMFFIGKQNGLLWAMNFILDLKEE